MTSVVLRRTVNTPYSDLAMLKGIPGPGAVRLVLEPCADYVAPTAFAPSKGHFRAFVDTRFDRIPVASRVTLVEAQALLGAATLLESIGSDIKSIETAIVAPLKRDLRAMRARSKRA